VTELAAAIAAFVVADVEGWPGLPSPARLSDLAHLLDVEPADRYPGVIGEPPAPGVWLAVESDRYAGGLRVWLDPDDSGQVVLLEGIEPVDAQGTFTEVPDLGEPDAALEVALGPFWVPGGERVHAGRGLAVRVNPDNGLLLGVVGFAPTTAEDYRARLRPHTEPTRPLLRHGAGGSS